jgi:hypothetical protein
MTRAVKRLGTPKRARPLYHGRTDPPFLFPLLLSPPKDCKSKETDLHRKNYKKMNISSIPKRTAR